MVKKFLYISLLSCMVIACNNTPKEAYYTRGEPEGLLDYSSEVVNLKLDSPASLQEMVDIITKEQPSKAEIKCESSDSVCRDAKKILLQFAVKTKYESSPRATASLHFERVLARDCQNRYIDLTHNPDNLNSPSFGCSVAVNLLETVSNKRQFIDPAIMEKPDARKPLQAITSYDKPSSDSTSFSTNLSAGGR